MLEIEAPPQLVLTIDILAVIVFAVSGALVASRKRLDMVGFMWLAVLTGVGGGTVRDLLLDVPVFWMVAPHHIIACLVTAGVVHFTAHLMESRYRLLLWFDALGLALVTVAGTAKGLDNGTGALVAVAMGVVTGTVGGIVRDLIGNEPSVILRREIYVTASGLGACTYVILAELALPALLAGAAGVLVTFTVRGLAITYNWSMPAYRHRPGRTLKEIEDLRK
ncbi:trimeric intracellular cation channel family protein [Pelagibius litoralis]|uniref:Trimeric intracellular cation channel family protein n=1 Tax=Pelagibius litoralis TaxID=374515 RepID=A0A967F0A8_9PROT|nr:trimeric intracellular cation channel family protein [Pelagibius litoralis]NIA70654.1 trimeric intracellular cation channel family protein [Pelagibius litoralis]